MYLSYRTWTRRSEQSNKQLWKQQTSTQSVIIQFGMYGGTIHPNIYLSIANYLSLSAPHQAQPISLAIAEQHLQIDAYALLHILDSYIPSNYEKRKGKLGSSFVCLVHKCVFVAVKGEWLEQPLYSCISSSKL